MFKQSSSNIPDSGKINVQCCFVVGFSAEVGNYSIEICMTSLPQECQCKSLEITNSITGSELFSNM